MGSAEVERAEEEVMVVEKAEVERGGEGVAGHSRHLQLEGCFHLARLLLFGLSVSGSSCLYGCCRPSSLQSTLRRLLIAA